MKRDEQLPIPSPNVPPAPPVRTTPEEVHRILARLVEGEHLSERETHDLFTAIMTGRVSDVHVAAILAVLQHRGPVVAELSGAARVMREHVHRVDLPPDIDPARVVDTCGTGGAPKTFNVSTMAAIVAAACGAIVPKHGNRSRTGRGSAEILESLGVNIDAGPAVQARCLGQIGICFSFAVHHHPAIRHVMPVRRALAIPTIYNLLGPLTNPAGARRQLLGVYAPHLTELMGKALAQLGVEHALVVHGLDGLDELTTTAPNRVCEVRGRAVTERELDAVDLGLAPARLEDLQVSSLAQAVEVARQVLAGAPGPARDIVILNAGAACYLAGIAATLREGVQCAADAVDRGEAAATLARLVELSHEPASG